LKVFWSSFGGSEEKVDVGKGLSDEGGDITYC